MIGLRYFLSCLSISFLFASVLTASIFLSQETEEKIISDDAKVFLIVMGISSAMLFLYCDVLPFIFKLMREKTKSS